MKTIIHIRSFIRCILKLQWVFQISFRPRCKATLQDFRPFLCYFRCKMRYRTFIVFSFFKQSVDVFHFDRTLRRLYLIRHHNAWFQWKAPCSFDRHGHKNAVLWRNNSNARVNCILQINDRMAFFPWRREADEGVSRRLQRSCASAMAPVLRRARTGGILLCVCVEASISKRSRVWHFKDFSFTHTLPPTAYCPAVVRHIWLKRALLVTMFPFRTSSFLPFACAVREHLFARCFWAFPYRDAFFTHRLIKYKHVGSHPVALLHASVSLMGSFASDCSLREAGLWRRCFIFVRGLLLW